MKNPPPSTTPGIRPYAEAVFVWLVLFATSCAGIFSLALEAVSIQKQTVRGDLLRLAQASAGLVDGDLHEKLVNSSQASPEDYQCALAPLLEFHKGVPEIAYLYTLVEKGGALHFGLDTATAADKLGFAREMKASPLLEPYQSNSPEEDRAELEALRRGSPYVSEEPFSDEFGSFLTALAPIKTRDGRAVGVVGLDLNLSDYTRFLDRVWRAAWLACGFVFLASLLVGALVFRIRTRLQRQVLASKADRADKEALVERNRLLVEALGQIVYHYNAAEGRVDWHGECEAMLGIPPGDMPGSLADWENSLQSRDADAAREAWQEAEKNGSLSLIREYRWLHRQGHPVWLLDRTVLSRDPAGRLTAADGVLLDISLRKKSESDLRAALSAAEAAGRAKSNFLAIISHEIRTPLNGMLGCANLLLTSATSPEQQDYLATIRKCGDTLLLLLTDILDFSKMESDKLVLETQPFSLRQCVEGALDLYGLMASEKKIELLADFRHPDLDFVSGDELRFRQILVNLVGNALKFTADGEVVVTLSRKPWLPGGNALMLSVRDTGIGIPKDKLQGIFLPFNQADTSPSRRFGGTGLGLAICGRLATLMGGAITVHSEEGRGSEFVVLLPLLELEEKNPHLDSGALHGKRAVVLDDSAAFRSVLCGLLASFGMESGAAANVQELKNLLAASRCPPDVFFFDADLPADVSSQALSALACGRVPPPAIALVTPGIAPAETGFPALSSLLKPLHRDALHRLLLSLFSPSPLPVAPQPPAPQKALLAEQFPLKILVVEDTEINRKVVLRLLSRLGYSPLTAENGRECIELMESQSFDLVLMDIQMPEMDGYEATTTLRARGDSTWITALTADAMPEDPIRCRTAGMNDYLSKPLRTESLSAALERCAIARKKLRV